MIVGLLLGMTATVWTGWVMILRQHSRIERAEEGHEVPIRGMLFPVTLHVGEDLLASWRRRENLVRAMIMGRQRRAGRPDLA